MSDPQKQYLSVAEFAQLSGVHPRTVRRRIADGTIRAYRFGPRVIRIDPADLDAAFAEIPSAAVSR